MKGEPLGHQSIWFLAALMSNVSGLFWDADAEWTISPAPTHQLPSRLEMSTAAAVRATPM